LLRRRARRRARSEESSNVLEGDVRA
jgi:hypothetical protein